MTAVHVHVNPVDPEGRVVAFRCKAGHGVAVARWMGDQLPAQGADAFVELSVPDALTEWRPASPTSRYDMELGPDGTILTGEVLRVGEPGDPVVALRVGTDVVLVEVEVEGEFEVEGKGGAGSREDAWETGRRVSFAVRPVLEVYPYSL